MTINKKVMAGSIALAVLAAPFAASPALAHSPGPAKCWKWKHHHWVWVCKRYITPIYQPYPYVYFPTFTLFFGSRHHHHHHMKKW